MPVPSYGVLKATVVDTRREEGSSSPHLQIHALGGAEHFRIAVNVLSQQSPSELLFVIKENFQHPLLTGLPGLAPGFHALPSQPGGLAIDFIRANVVDRAEMRTLPPSLPGPDNDLEDRLGHFASRAQNESGALMYAFGSAWGPEASVPDKIFGFSPGRGVHNIHMNQGNSGRFTGDDGVWQDGALLFYFPATRQWVAIFLAFQSQSWHTDDATGHTLPNSEPGPIPGPNEPDGQLSIVAALVNPPGADPGHETVTLLNTTAQTVNLAGWNLANRAKQRFSLSGSLGAGDTLRVTLDATCPLGNGGGAITLLDGQGRKVSGVAYTAQQAGTEGRTIKF